MKGLDLVLLKHGGLLHEVFSRYKHNILIITELSKERGSSRVCSEVVYQAKAVA